MKEQLSVLDIYTDCLRQMMPVLLDSYVKAKANNLLDDELSPLQENALQTLPNEFKQILGSIRNQIY